eukprot:scaffold93657_cov64-Phaeocystis_antarctica.AAC.3
MRRPTCTLPARTESTTIRAAEMPSRAPSAERSPLVHASRSDEPVVPTLPISASMVSSSSTAVVAGGAGGGGNGCTGGDGGGGGGGGGLCGPSIGTVGGSGDGGGD